MTHDKAAEIIRKISTVMGKPCLVTGLALIIELKLHEDEMIAKAFKLVHGTLTREMHKAYLDRMNINHGFS